MSIRDEAFSGKPLSCPVIDAHTHIGAYQLSGWHQKYDRTPTDKVLEDLARLGIDCIVTAPHPIVQGRMEEANLISAEAISRYTGRVFAYIAVVPTCGMETVKQELSHYSKNPGFVGLKFLPGFYHGALTAPEYQYAMDFADEMGCPVLCHIWGEEPRHCDIETALKTRHNMKFIIAHQGGGEEKYTRIAAPIVTGYENAYLELCGSMDNRLGVKSIAEMVGEDKVIFGTDAINLDPKYELGKVALSPLNDSTKRKIFSENYLSILNSSAMGRIKLA